VIDDYSISNLEPAAARAGFNDKSRGLVSGDDALVALRAFAQVFVIDGANIGAANCGRFDGEEHFTVSWPRNRNFPHLDGAVPREKRRFHHLAHFDCLCFRRIWSPRLNFRWCRQFRFPQA
jgi:hypothetical protein